MKSCAFAARAAASMSAVDACGEPYAMLLAIVSSNSTVSCVTMPICRRSDASVDLPHVDAVNENRAGAHVVEARQQVDQRRLAGAASADDGDHLAGPNGERHAAQDPRRGLSS